MQKISGVPQVGGYNFTASPRSEVIELLKHLPLHSKVLDIGAGFGNNTRLLLEQGHQVVATETLPEAVEYLETLKQKYENLEVLCQPVQALITQSTYDAVICAMVLHFLSNHEVTQAMRAIQNATKVGGYNVIINHLTDPKLSKEYIHQFRADELKEYYNPDSWNVIFYQESYPEKPLTPHPFKSARIIAQKLR